MMESQRGDPNGRRIAVRRSGLLAEASAVARALWALLRRAGFETTACDDLMREITRQEQVELQKSYGRIEPRSRFKTGTPSRALEGQPANHLFLDESGNSAGRPGGRGDQFFALGAIAMSTEVVEQYIHAADAIKQRFFGCTDITFHEPYMRNWADPFYLDGVPEKQQEFDLAVDNLIATTDFVVFGVGIRKVAFAKDFVATGIDPYLPSDSYALAITLLLERYVDFLAYNEQSRMGRLTFESQGAREDAYHQLEYSRLLLEGSQWVPHTSFRNWLETGLRFTPKRGSDPVELADMFSRDLFEWIASDCTLEPKRWKLFSQKVYCRGDGMMGKFGVKVFPDSDIRDRIEKHRAEHGASIAR